ncbi:hypothetical protein ACPCYV_19025 [Streptomyces mordarskii]
MGRSSAHYVACDALVCAADAVAVAAVAVSAAVSPNTSAEAMPPA